MPTLPSRKQKANDRPSHSSRIIAVRFDRYCAGLQEGEAMTPDPIEHARILVFEEFPDNIQMALFLTDENVRANPGRESYWQDVGKAVKFWADLLERSAEA